MIARIALLLIALALLAHGGEELYAAARSRVQASLTCDEYSRQRPGSNWVRLSGCELDYVRVGYRETEGRLSELLFPLRPAGSDPAMPASMILATHDPAVLEVAAQAIGASAPQRDPDAFIAAMLDVVTAMAVSGDIEGLARSPLGAYRTRPSIAAIHTPLDENFTVVDLRAQPRPLVPAIEIAAGANGLLMFLFLSMRARRKTGSDAVLATEMPTVPAPTSLRGLMLLNLPGTATANEIEAAPPLGTQESVRAMLASVLPGLSFDERGRATFTRPDVVARVDLAGGPVVHTAVISLEGEAADATLLRLLSKTGWRAFSAKGGSFL
ncbi:MAG: hypothetical protein ABIS06_05780 [Vicinamibacterales bacterium]